MCVFGRPPRRSAERCPVSDLPERSDLAGNRHGGRDLDKWGLAMSSPPGSSPYATSTITSRVVHQHGSQDPRDWRHEFVPDPVCFL